MDTIKCYICSSNTLKSRNLFNDPLLVICNLCESDLLKIANRLENFDVRSKVKDFATRRHSDVNIRRNLIELARRLEPGEIINDYLLGVTFTGLNPIKNMGFYSGMACFTNNRFIIFIPKPKGIIGEIIGCSFEYSSSIDNIIEIIIKRHLIAHNFTIRDKGGNFKPTKDLKIIENDSVIQNFIQNFTKLKSNFSVQSNNSKIPSSNNDNLEKLKKLKELLDLEIINIEEFESKKKDLLKDL